jgi:hypothetical protein
MAQHAGTVSYRTFATARELERLLADDLAVLLSESFAGAAASARAPDVSPAGEGEADEAELPAGTVTFLLTDIEGSTRLWETVPDAMEIALERHNRLLTGVIEDHGGVVVTSRGEGDSFSPFSRGRLPRLRRPARASSGWPGRGGRRVPRCGCGWGCTPARRGCAAVTVSTTRRSTGAPG